MTTNQHHTIGCVSMTHLGLIHAVAFAEKGFNLICYDHDDALIAQLKDHHLPVSEPDLDALVAKNTTRLHFTSELSALKQCDLVFIACDVPTDDEGNSQLSVIEDLIETVTPVLSDHACLILLSQVPPGFTREIMFPKHRLFYQVETLVFGRAMERALYPERYIVGVHDPHKTLPAPYFTLLASFHCPILTMRYESAELTKISINLFLVSTVTTTNTIAEICENIGADWEEIAPALRLDKRIGQHAYLTPGLGIAGGNLERDLNTIMKLGRAYSTDVGVVEAWLKNSRYRRDWVLRCLKKALAHLDHPRICILGLAYKPNTHSVKNSPSIALINQLKHDDVRTHDPVVKGAPLTHAIQCQTVLEAIEQADAVVLMTPWADYQDLSIEQLRQHMRGNTIIDPHRLLKPDPTHALQIEYFALGKPAHVMKEEQDYA